MACVRRDPVQLVMPNNYKPRQAPHSPCAVEVLCAVVEVPGVVVAVPRAEGHAVVAAPLVRHGVAGSASRVAVDVQAVRVLLRAYPEVRVLRPVRVTLERLQLHAQTVVSCGGKGEGWKVKVNVLKVYFLSTL
jgi:hypothetical protein